MVEFNWLKIVEYGLDIEQFNILVCIVFVGEMVGVVFENE